jgi:hypothetical protein
MQPAAHGTSHTLLKQAMAGGGQNFIPSDP